MPKAKDPWIEQRPDGELWHYDYKQNNEGLLCPPVKKEKPPCDIELQLTGGGQVEPGAALDNLVLEASCDGQPAEVAVEISNTVEPGSGGHEHGPDDDQRRLGSYSADTGSNCSAGSRPGTMNCTVNGTLEFSYFAPQAAGSHLIKVRCTDKPCSPPSPAKVDVKVDGLEGIPASSWYTLNEAAGDPVGDTPEHPDNHFLTREAANVLELIARDYARSFGPLGTVPRNPEQLHINDASLEWGGLFDLDGLWNPPHREHRRGTVVDIRANQSPGTIPPGRRPQFKQIAALRGVHAGLHSPGSRNQHYHARLSGRGE